MSTITAGTGSTNPIVVTGNTDGTLVLKTNDTGSGGTAAITLDTSQNATFAGKVTSATSLILASNGTTTAVTIDTAKSLNLSGAYTEAVVAIGTVTTTNTLSLASGTVQTATLTASTACTFTMPTVTAGKSFMLFLKQAASTGNGTATFTNVKWGTAGAPTITATAGKMDILTFAADGTNWYGSIAQGYTP